MRVWFDQALPMPAGYDRRCETARDALGLLRTGRVAVLSIGYDERTAGTEVLALAVLVESMAASGALPRLVWTIHADEPLRMRAIAGAFRTAELHWRRHAENESTGLAVTPSGRLIAYTPTR